MNNAIHFTPKGLIGTLFISACKAGTVEFDFVSEETA
jgi:hypothetical protein